MKKLLNNQFYLIRKSLFLKIILIAGIIFGVFAIIQGSMFANFGDREMPGGEAGGNRPGGGGPMSFAVDGKSIFSSSYGLGIGFAIIVAVLLAVMIVNEFTNGTIRNKIIAGNKKSTVYLSMIISYVSTGLVLILGYSLIRLLLGTAVLGYSEDVAFSASEFGYIMKTIGLSLLVYIAIFSITVLFASLIKNMGVTIIAVLGLVILLNATTNIYQLIADWTWLETLCDFNPANMLSAIVNDSLSTSQLLITIFGSLGISSAAIGGGMLLFRRNDLK